MKNKNIISGVYENPSEMLEKFNKLNEITNN